MISTVKKDEDIRDCENIRDLASLLDLDLKTLLFFAYNNSSLYKHYKIKKKSGGHRMISAPDQALKSTCAKLNYYLSNVYEEFLPNSAHGFVSGRTIITNASNHVGRAYVLNIDLDDFFGSINSGRVMGLFRRHPFRFGPKLRSVLAGITTLGNSLPQGSPCSPVIANMVCLKMDKELIRLSQKNGWRYSRYADDITFTTNKLTVDLASVLAGNVTVGKAIERIIRRNGFLINPKKTRLAVPGKSKWVTGVKVNKKLNVSRRYIREIRSMLNAWETYSEVDAENVYNKKYNLGAPKSFRQVLRGKIDHLGNVRTKQDLLYRRLYNRLCDLEGKYEKRLPESRKDEYQNKVVVIKSSLGYGSAFFITKNILVTCAHVVGGDRSVEYTIRQKRLPVEFKTASVLEVLPQFDLAILYSISDNTDLIFPSNMKKTHSSFSQEEDYVAVGYGGFRSDGGFWKEPAVVDERIVHKDTSTTGIHSYQVNNPMWGGMSGGPVISKQTGCVDGYIVNGSETLQGSTTVVSFRFYPISNVPRQYLQSAYAEPQEDVIAF